MEEDATKIEGYEAESKLEPIKVTVTDVAGVRITAEAMRDPDGEVFVTLPLDSFVATKGDGTMESLPEAVARLEAELERLRPLPGEHEKRGQVLAHVAAALGEVASVNGTGAGVDPWYYKARALLASVGHHVPELRENHLADIVQAMRDAKAAGAPFRTEDVAPEVLEMVGDHPITLWESYLAQHYPDAPTSAPPHLVYEICPRCQGFGGAPERIRLLCGEIARRDRAVNRNADIAEARKEKHDELAAAAQTIAADNKAKDDEITELRAAIRVETDQRAGAETALAELVEHERLQADQIDAATAAAASLEARLALATKALAEMSTRLAEAQAALEALELEHAAVTTNEVTDG
jgi:hypothetical protein